MVLYRTPNNTGKWPIFQYLRVLEGLRMTDTETHHTQQ